MDEGDKLDSEKMMWGRGGAGVKTRQGCTVQERIQTAYQVQWESQRDLRQVDMVWVRE